MNLIEVGGLLKRERERRRLSLRDVMEATKISRRNLMALEAGEADHLPHSVYLKGYVRNYAKLLGLDPEPLVAVVDRMCDEESGYLAPENQARVCAPAPDASGAPEQPGQDGQAQEPERAQEPEQPSAQEPAPQQAEAAPAEPPRERPEPAASQVRFPRPEKAPRRLRLWPWLVLLALAAALAFAFVQYQRIQAALEEAQPMAVEANATEANATEANASIPAETGAVEPAANASAAAPEPAPAPAPAPVPAPAPEPAPKAAAQVSGPGGATPPAPASKPATPPVAAPSIEVTRKPQAPAAEPRTPGMQELVVTAKAGETCWVELSEGAQKKSFIVSNGESRRFEFTSRAKVRLGNAGGVSFQLNGAPYPYEGERGQTATLDIGGR